MKLIEILRSLDADGRNRINKAIQQVYKPKSLECRTWDYIYAHPSLLDHLSVDYLKAKVEHMGSKSSYRNVILRLCNYLEQNIAAHELFSNNQESLYHLILGKYYKNRGELRLFREHMKKGQTAVFYHSAYDPIRSIRELEQHYELVYSELDYDGKQDSYNDLGNSVSDVKEVMDLLLSIESANKNSPYQRNLETQLEENIPTTRLVHLLKLAQQLVKDQSAMAFCNLQSIVLADHLDMPGYLVQMMLIYMNNFCYAQIRAGHDDYYRELIKNNEFGLSFQYLLSQGLLTERRFINMVEWKSYFESNDSVLKFISTWAGKLKSDHIKTVILLGHALRYFGQRHYDEVLEALHVIKIPVKKYQLQLLKRWILLCTLSTYKEHKHFGRELEAAEKYFIRNKGHYNTSLFNGSMNLIKVLRLFKREVTSDTISDSVHKMDALVMRYWITKRMRERHAFV